MKLIAVDLDGTLFDTRMVNYLAYREAVQAYGYDIDYSYFCEYGNGRHYLEFLPQITTSDIKTLNRMHEQKKAVYKKYLSSARLNSSLLDLLFCAHGICKTALVTTASRQNVSELLEQFQLADVFDLIVTQEDVSERKPNPEGYLKVLAHFGIKAEEAVAFEDSESGIEAAECAGFSCFVVRGYR